jgi:AcrR family transcriptional regulator
VLGKVELGPHRHAVVVAGDRCTGCARCVKVCRSEALSRRQAVSSSRIEEGTMATDQPDAADDAARARQGRRAERHRDRAQRHAEHHAKRAERHAARAEHLVDHTERLLSRRERRHLDTRDEILAAAHEVLHERGAADLSLREIARRVDLSPGALYKYFDSKDDLVGALADHAMAALLERFATVPSDLTPDERAVEMGLAYLEFARRNPEDVSIIAVHEATIHMQPLSPEHRRLEEAVTGVFKEGVAKGVFKVGKEEDADFMAYGAWALVQGLATFEQQQRPALAAKVRDKQRQLLHVFVNGLKSDWSALADQSQGERRGS